MNPSQRFTRREMLTAATAGGAAALVGRQTLAGAAGKGSALRIVDPHVHVWKNDPKYPWPEEVKTPPKDDALPSRLVKLMRANGVEKTVIVHVIHYRWDCRYAGDAIKADPKRFMGVCRVNPTAPTAPDDLTHWVRDYGFHGVRLSPSGGPASDWINDRAQMDRIWSRATQ